ncbi:MAG: tRNA (N(6)-L-threonylcarbamoyladenosine(37)-C(2))-methylthiotransferase MtaB [Bacillota bacterium]|nr:tRNA (N(6)-L-threonylcarbamoyladenosine(37)-C(2))-methylthiotransferase MtaB [Bacillota bacterium]
MGEEGGSQGRKKAAFYTLGCKVNQQETAALQELFRQHGYEIVPFGSPADVYIINTCTVTHLADRKSRQMIRRAAAQNDRAVVAVVGCYAQVAAEEVASLDGVDVVVGTQDRGRLVELVERAARRKEEGGDGAQIIAVRPLEEPGFEELPLPYTRIRTRAFLKIQDGCDQCCAYCIVPRARGGIRSLKPELVRERLERLLKAGYREVVLTGVHTSAYGRDLPGPHTLAGLLKELVLLPGEFRLRLSSVEPGEVTEDLLDVVAGSPRICRHLHIPLQSGDDEILCLMRRPYTTAQYRELFHRIQAKIPGVAVTTDVMAGFPGETDRHFENSYEFISSLPFRDLHVFKYSPRPGTPASRMPEQIPPEVKELRSKRLRALAGEMAAAYAKRFVGEMLTVLAERRARRRRDCWEGLSDNYLRVVFPALPEKQELRGAFIRVRILNRDGDALSGEPVLAAPRFPVEVDAGRF